jgi:hypothetical protein
MIGLTGLRKDAAVTMDVCGVTGRYYRERTMTATSSAAARICGSTSPHHAGQMLIQ